MTQADLGAWRYAPGSGLLLGTRDRWLLLADQPDEAVILDLWDALTSVGLEQAMAVLERAYAGRVPAVAGWDAGHTVVRGEGYVATTRSSQSGCRSRVRGCRWSAGSWRVRRRASSPRPPRPGAGG